VVGKLIQDNHHLIDYHPNTWTSAGFMVDWNPPCLCIPSLWQEIRGFIYVLSILQL
jgi:hypothetical protein